MKTTKRERDMMTTEEKAILVDQAGQLFRLGLKVERCREKLRKLVEKKVPYNSPHMWTALLEFQAADSEWKELEQKHLQLRKKIHAVKAEHFHP
jgi:hypothetical protein